MDIFPELVQIEIARHLIPARLNARALVAMLNGGPLPSDDYTPFLWPERYNEIHDLVKALRRAVAADNDRQVAWITHRLGSSAWKVLYVSDGPSNTVLDAIADICVPSECQKLALIEDIVFSGGNSAVRMAVWANQRLDIWPTRPKLYVYAGDAEDLDMFKWLRASGCPLHKSAVHSLFGYYWPLALTKRLAILQWLVVDQNCPYDSMFWLPREMPQQLRDFANRHMSVAWVKPQGFKVALKRRRW